MSKKKKGILIGGMATVAVAAILVGLLLMWPEPKPDPYHFTSGNAEVISPTEGMVSQDMIVYNTNAVDKGADPTGAKDSTEAIQDALNGLKNTGGVVFLPAGQYKVEGTLDIPGGVTLRGEWLSPEEEGGLGSGTILMAYYGRGSTDSAADAFVRMSGASVFRDISVWYPEQVAADIQPYPATIYGEGHTAVLNVTLYNSYIGFWNPSCSSMMIRGLYGTVLNTGIYGANAYDIPRIERVKFDPSYWSKSELKNCPTGEWVDELEAYTRDNLVGIKAGQMDWGYWYDLEMNHIKYGILMVHGNDAIGKIKIADAEVGIYIDNMSYPGLEVSYADIEADTAGIFLDEAGSEDEDSKGTQFDNASLAVSASTFRGWGVGIHALEDANFGINLNDCVFESWGESAIQMAGGHLVCANGDFRQKKPALHLEDYVGQVVLTGNRFANKNDILVDTDYWEEGTDRIVRDDDCTDVLHTPEYNHVFIPENKPAKPNLYNVSEYGAVVGTVEDIPEEDSTAAIQKALDAAGKNGGGTVYLPGGVYRVNGSLKVPSGVELRGSYDGPHYGNSTWVGTQLYAYGNKDNEKGAPLIALSENAGVNGFTVFYPEQGYSDTAWRDSYKVSKYPATVQANKDTWIRNMAMVACYTAIDAMTNRCDNIVIYDVTGAAMNVTLKLGHGTNGGVVQNLHFNYSGWTQQGSYESQPTGQRDELLTEYTSRVVKGMILGDCKNVDFFSSFNIIVNTQISLIKDPYTGGSCRGTMWGVAFDAAQHGVVADGDCDAELTLINSMGVFNQQGGGYNVVTKPGFKGTINMFNQDAWGSNSKLAYVEGGTVNLVQYFSWCAYEAECLQGGTLNLLGCTIISNNGDNGGELPAATYRKDGKGKVVGCLDCDSGLHIVIEEGAKVDKKLNGIDHNAW